MNAVDSCSICGAQLIQKNRSRLLLAAFVFLAAAFAVVLVIPSIWIAMAIAIFAGLISAYFLVWIFLGKALWCRRCKRFPVG